MNSFKGLRSRENSRSYGGEKVRFSGHVSTSMKRRKPGKSFSVSRPSSRVTMRGMASPGSREKDGRHRDKNRGCTENAGEKAEGGGKYGVAAVREHRSYPQSFPDAPRRGFAVQQTHDVGLARSQTKAQDKRCNGERPKRRK